jgi:O-antigen ligase
MFLNGSRSATDWLNLGRPVQGIDIVEGSPLDRSIYLVLTIAAVIVLGRRRLLWWRFGLLNSWLLVFFLFSGLSVAWSPEPLMSLKRLVRAAGNPLMALVVVTDVGSYRSMVVVLRRLSLIALPLSILFIRYYPEYGRVYHMGFPLWTGIATHKNTLGQLCLLAGICSCWSLLYGEKGVTRAKRWLSLDAVVFGMAVYLIAIIDSATSTLCLAIVLTLLGLSRVPVIARAPGRILWVGLTLGVLAFAAEQTFDVRNRAIEALGRDPSLTTRVPMWEDLLAAAPRPLTGSGFESYWTSEEGRVLGRRWGAIQAHNGYLEMYLNLGCIGLMLFVGGVVSGLFQTRKHLTVDWEIAVLRLVMMAAVLPYNWTEATFRGSSNLWMLLLWAIVDHTSVAGRAMQHQPSADSLRAMPAAGSSVQVGRPANWSRGGLLVRLGGGTPHVVRSSRRFRDSAQ